MGYVVTSPLVQAKKADGSYVHVYEGGFLPDDVDPAHLEQLVGGGMVEEATPPAEDDKKPAARKRK